MTLTSTKITNITINGIIERVGDGVNGFPTVTIAESNGSNIILDISQTEAKEFANHLYEKVSIQFDATVQFLSE